MSDEKKLSQEELERLTDEMLEEISGGVLRKVALPAVESMMRTLYAGGYRYSEVKRIVRDKYNANPKAFSKDGDPDDFNKIMDFFDENWNRIREEIDEKYKDW